VKAGRSPLVVVGLVVIALLIAVALLAPQLAPFDPRALSGASLERPSADHLLGTDNIGQDILSQLIRGTRSSMVVALGAAGLSVLAGALVGLSAGLRGGFLDTFLMRLADVFLGVPAVPVAVLVGAMAGARRISVVLVIAALSWPVTARVLRSEALSLRERGFVRAAGGFGAGPLYVIRRHLLPAVAPLAVAGFLGVAAHAVLVEAGLAFLGLADPTSQSWGLVLNRALLHQGLYFSWLWTWWVLPAGLAITVAILAFTCLGVGLEPVFNRRLPARS
jgi:peptide/nickel transport system permease protein